MTLLKSQVRPRRPSAARVLLDAAVAQARAEPLYARMGAPDTVEGRFELLTAHVILLCERLAAAGAGEEGQALFDAFLRDLDGALREMAVGDLAVPRRMKVLGEAYYGRALAYRRAFSAAGPALSPALADLVRRTILEAAPQADPAPLAAYLLACSEALAAAPADRLLAGDIPWPSLERHR